MKNLVYALLIIFVWGCSKEPAIVTESEVLNELLSQAPHQVIDLDETPVDTVYAETFIDFHSPELEREDVLIHNVRSLNHTDDYFYVVSSGEPFIVQFDREGNFLEAAGTKGQGPDEYDIISNVANNSEHIYILDGGNARVNVYDHAMEQRGIFFNDGINTFSRGGNNTPATDEVILFHANRGYEHLIRVISADSTYHEITSFLPSLIPPGMQPMAVNNFVAGMSETGHVAASYFGLPYLLFFDESFAHIHTIVLESEDFDGHISSLEPLPDTGGGVGVYRLTSHIRWINEATLVIANRHVITILNMVQGRYEVQGRYRLAYANPEHAPDPDNSARIHVVNIDNEYLYVTSLFDDRVNRVALSALGL